MTGWPNRNRFRDLEELFGMLVLLALLIFPLVTATMPFLRSYDPLSRLLDPYMTEHVRAFLAAGIQSVIALFGAASCADLLLFSMTTTSCPKTLASDNLFRSKRITSVKNVEGSSSMLIQGFKEQLKRHNQIYTMVDVINEETTVYVPTLQGVGLLLIVSCNYGIVTFNGKTELVLYMLFVCISIIFTIINLFLLDFASKPSTATKDTIKLWEGVRLGPAQKRQVRAMRVAAIALGPFAYIDKTSGLNILDAIPL